MWTWTIGVASVSYFMAGLLPPLLGIDPFTVTQQTFVGVALIVLVTLLNMLGPTVLKLVTRLCLVAEVVGSVFLAFVLLLSHREHSLSILTERAGATPHDFAWSGLFLAIALIGYTFSGYESACSMAEEIKDPARHLPKIMIYAVFALGGVTLLSSLALLLAVPDLPKVMLGQVTDPAADTIVAALGAGIAKPFLVLILLAFAATLVASHTTASRVLWSFARDGAVPASEFLVRLSGRSTYPIRCLATIGALSTVVMLSAFSNNPGEDILSLIAAGEKKGVYTRPQAISVAITILLAGHETTLTLITNGLRLFIQHPDQWDLLRTDPDGLAQKAVEECLRMEPSLVGIGRCTTRDVELSSTVIPADDVVYGILATANRDPRVFEAPESFDITRFPNRHVSFGGGIHHCLGAALARLESQIAFAALAKRFERFELAQPTIDYLPDMFVHFMHQPTELNVAW